MATKIIELDGILVEAEVVPGKVASRDGIITNTIDAIRPMLVKITRPVAEAWKEIGDQVVIEKAEIEVGFGVEQSGTLFLASTKGNVNLKIKLLVSRNRTKQ
ncbi:MAG TPA: CU044_2847 family protein [Terriglobia bacterium]|nr:CU044_2847 family protein [Terriglobia bacterium]